MSSKLCKNCGTVSTNHFRCNVCLVELESYMPTRRQIRVATEAIQQEWSEHEREQRVVGCRRKRVEVQVVSRESLFGKNS